MSFTLARRIMTWGLPPAVVALAYLPVVGLHPMNDDLIALRWARDATWSSILFERWMGEPLYRPLATLTLPLELAWLGTAGAQAVTVLMHAAVVALVTALARRMGLNRPAAALAGLWFGLHPLHSTVVTALTGRTDLMCTLAMLAALVCLPTPRDGPVPSRRAVGLTLTACGAALLAKEAAVVLPALLLWRWWLAGGRDDGPFAWKPWLPLLAGPWLLLLFYLPLHASISGGAAGRLLGYWGATPWPARATWVDYLIILSAPVGILLRHVAWLLPVLALAGAWYARRHRGVALFAAGWFLLLLLPTLPFLYVITPRNLYAPLVAVALLMGVAAQQFQGSPRSRWVNIAVAVLVAALLLTSLAHLQRRVGDAREAANEVATILDAIVERVPNPAPNAGFVIAGLPVSTSDTFFVRGHWQLARGLEPALRDRYGRDDIRAVRAERSPPNWPGDVLRLFLTYDPRTRGVYEQNIE